MLFFALDPETRHGRSAQGATRATGHWYTIDMETFNALQNKKRWSLVALVALFPVLVAMCVYDVVSKGEYWFVFIAIAEAVVCADFALRYRAAHDSVRFDPDALVLSRRGRETRVPYGSIESLAEERHAVVRVLVSGGKGPLVHADFPRDRAIDDPLRTVNRIREGIRENSGREVPTSYRTR